MPTGKWMLFPHSVLLYSDVITKEHNDAIAFTAVRNKYKVKKLCKNGYGT